MRLRTVCRDTLRQAAVSATVRKGDSVRRSSPTRAPKDVTRPRRLRQSGEATVVRRRSERRRDASYRSFLSKLIGAIQRPLVGLGLVGGVRKVLEHPRLPHAIRDARLERGAFFAMSRLVRSRGHTGHRKTESASKMGDATRHAMDASS